MINQTEKHLNIGRIISAFFVVVIATIIAIMPLEVNAAGDEEVVSNGAYEIAKYEYYADVDKTHTYTVSENITVNFPDSIDKIQFTMPEGNFRMTDITVDDMPYQISTRGVENYLDIRDQSLLVKGEHTFHIKYTIKEFEDRDTAEDHLYIDVLQHGWMKPITAIDIKVHLPEDFDWGALEYYAGQFGVQNMSTKLNYYADHASGVVTVSGKYIPENFGITLKATLDDGYWEGALDGSWAIKYIMILALVVALIIFIMWLIGGRDPKVEKTKQIHPIEGITPVEMGYVFIGRVRIRDIIALILYMGIKGYLKISEFAPKRYQLIRLNDPVGEAKFIRTAYDTLFEDVPKERGVDIRDMYPQLRRVKKTISDSIADGFTKSDMLAYTPLSRIFRIIGTAVVSVSIGVVCALKYSYAYMPISWVESFIVTVASALALMFLCKQFDRYYYSEEKEFTRRLIALAILFAIVPIYVGARTVSVTGNWLAGIIPTVLALFSALMIILMRARAKGNAELASRFLQLRHHIYHPEAKDIAANVFEDINYYYEIVPYAYLFSGLEAWAISFLTLDVPEPDWYSDDIEGHAITNLRTDVSTVDYAKDLKAFTRTLEDAYHSTGKKMKK